MMGIQFGGKYVAYGWFASLIIGLGSSAIGAAPPPSPETAAEIERALSVPGKAQPGLQLRGGPGPTAPGVGKLRGPAGIVSDPTGSNFPSTGASTPAGVSPSAGTTPPVEALDYPALVQDRPRVAALIHFDLNSARIRSDAYPLLNEYVSALKNPALAGAVLVIAGHTDSMGSSEANLALSQERAQAVKDYLVERGIDPGRLIARGYGEAYPVASNATAAGRELNRRSEFIRVDGR